MLRKAAPPPGVPCVLPWRVTGPALARRLRSSLPPGDSDDPPFSAVPEKPPPARIKRRTKPSATATTTTARRAPGNGSRGGGGGDRFPVHSDLPFDFRYSYSETDPSLRPLGFREPPRFSPFGPGRLDRTWDGVSAPAPAEEKPTAAAERAAVQGAPLTESEIEELVERYRHSDCSRQINLGKGGVTHNLLDDIHNHWKRAEAVRIKCLGAPTLDMDNLCFHLEDKTGGKIIYRRTNILLLYRGRNYDPGSRPAVPLMLWKPRAPIYPRLVKNAAEGLTLEQTKEMRSRGLNSPALMTLTRNGVYVNVVEKVREAFKTEEVVRLDCSYVETSDSKKIGVKLRDLVPCVPILFKKGQIVLWRGKQKQSSVGHQEPQDQA